MILFKNKRVSCGLNSSNPLDSGKQKFNIIILILGIFILLFVNFRPVSAQSVYQAQLVNKIDAYKWSPESPDPMGLGYSSSLGSILVVDSEVEETPQCHWHNVNYWQINLAGNVNYTASTLSFSKEPTEITYDSKRNRYYVSDDDAKKIFTVNIGSDKKFGTSDDQVIAFSTNKNNPIINDPEGAAYDSINDYLLIVDGTTNGTSSVYIFSPGANGKFDGTASAGDDVLIREIPTTGDGISDPEGVDFNYDKKTIYVTGQKKWVLEYDINGNLKSKIDTSAFNIRSQSGVAYGPSSTGNGRMSLYITDRGVDNDSSSCENDGEIFEIAVPGYTVPTATPTLGVPIIYAGDLDRDGHVTISDYTILMQNFGNTSCANIANIAGAQSGSCIVNVFDYNILLSDYGK